MQIIYERCCGLDVHKRTVVACVLVTLPAGTVQRTVRTFTTMTADLLALDDWLRELGITQIALESTGVYWRPIFNLLEDGRTVVLVNATHMHAVPGRKTDVKDSEWIADLLRHGLLRPSFIPPKPIRELRELTRYRKTLVQERADLVNRVQKVLETANIKLAAVATDVLGKSGRAMLEAIIIASCWPGCWSILTFWKARSSRCRPRSSSGSSRIRRQSSGYRPSPEWGRWPPRPLWPRLGWT